MTSHLAFPYQLTILASIAGNPCNSKKSNSLQPVTSRSDMIGEERRLTDVRGVIPILIELIIIVLDSVVQGRACP